MIQPNQVAALENEMRAAEYDLWMAVKASGRPFSAKNAREVIVKLYQYIAEATPRPHDPAQEQPASEVEPA